jgi:hypothetical protein
MSEFYDHNREEFDRLLGNAEERAMAIGEIFDDAIESADQKTLGRILETYPREYLDQILGGFPEYLYDELGKQE